MQLIDAVPRLEFAFQIKAELAFKDPGEGLNKGVFVGTLEVHLERSFVLVRVDRVV